jgi:cytochrome c oxidase assembly protein Cox11
MVSVTGRRTDRIRKPQQAWKRVLNLAVTVLVLLLGPIMFGVGNSMIEADEELARTGVQTAGTIVNFDDVTKASQRRIKVEFYAGDASVHATFAAVDHDQHPVVGDEVTVVYAEQDPGRAIVLGYESDGVWFRGAGTILILIFGGIGVVLVLAFLRGYFKKGARKPAA